MVVVCYVGDCLFFRLYEAEWFKIILNLEEQGLSLTQEDGNTYRFLGVGATKNDSKIYVMTQHSLIDKSLEATKITNSNPQNISAATGAPLSTCKE